MKPSSFTGIMVVQILRKLQKAPRSSCARPQNASLPTKLTSFLHTSNQQLKLKFAKEHLKEL